MERAMVRAAMMRAVMPEARVTLRIPWMMALERRTLVTLASIQEAPASYVKRKTFKVCQRVQKTPNKGRNGRPRRLALSQHLQRHGRPRTRPALRRRLQIGGVGGARVQHPLMLPTQMPCLRISSALIWRAGTAKELLTRRRAARQLPGPLGPPSAEAQRWQGHSSATLLIQTAVARMRRPLALSVAMRQRHRPEGSGHMRSSVTSWAFARPQMSVRPVPGI
mmetsp:Transcript_92677/g.271309  ORF Transcript_92677/g.271309 Transcript_92677/m.271309 type:complete len:222 (-) Transcript_92677:372-1037(-)